MRKATETTTAKATYYIKETHGAKGNEQDIWVPVKIVDTRTVYGRDHALITPIGGMGEAWVWLDCLRRGGARETAGAQTEEVI